MNTLKCSYCKRVKCNCFGFNNNNVDIPNKNAINTNIEMMPFKKYVESRNINYCEDKIKINGVFKDKETGKITKGDNFLACKLGNLSIEEIYKVYLDWFNYTRMPYEKEREFVSAIKGCDSPMKASEVSNKTTEEIR